MIFIAMFLFDYYKYLNLIIESYFICYKNSSFIAEFQFDRHKNDFYSRKYSIRSL